MPQNRKRLSLLCRALVVELIRESYIFSATSRPYTELSRPDLLKAKIARANPRRQGRFHLDRNKQ